MPPTMPIRYASSLSMSFATAQIKANPSRTIAPPIDWRLYKERHQVDCFFNKLRRFRRIALRCEKTITAFMGFVHLACAMIWIR